MKYDTTSGKLNEVWMNGFAEEEYGSCQEEGFSSALIVSDEIIGIIHEDSQGFVEYEVFSNEVDARNSWSDKMNMWQQQFNPEASYA